MVCPRSGVGAIGSARARDLTISTGYEMLGLLHILTVIAAFGPLFIYPSLRRAGDTARSPSCTCR